MTFWELISKNEIVIPLIQRDYAQGRKSEQDKAEAFLNAILEGTKKGLHLDFIYGKVDKDKKSFLPLDGQQRLTTLLLIHWFVSLENKYLIELEKFTYEVRLSTKDFIQKLTKKENWEQLSKSNIVASIENSSWFFLSWKKDPSVQALLNMLSLIEERFKEVKIEDLENIGFEFLNLDEFDLTDELYVKMNARGKPLSEFESFKAKFSELFTDPIDKAKLDNQWLDIFWERGQKEAEKMEDAPKLADEKYYNFFYNVTYNFYVENFDFARDNLKGKKLSSFYKEVYTKPILANLLKTLNNLDGNEPIFISFIDKVDIGYVERARFYALSLAYINGLNEKAFKEWMRVTLNLINNQRIDEAKEFKKVILSLKNLSQNIHDIYSYIENKPTNILSFNQIQREEEALKAELILKNNSWEEELIKAESHWYLEGQVGFLLNFSENTLDEFVNYREIFFTLFSEKIKKNIEEQTLIHRALLTYGDYLPRHGNTTKYTFCSFGTGVREKGENWREVFKKDIFKKLLDDTRSLKQIVDKFTFDCSDWQSYFINPKKDWEVLSYANHYQMEKNKKEIYLNQGNVGVTRWSWRRVGELYSYYLFKEQFEGKTFSPFTETWYWNSSSINEDKPCIVIRGLKKYQIEIYSKNNKFHINFLDRDKKEFPQKLIDILGNNNFKSKDDNWFYKRKVALCDKDDILSLVKKVCNDLDA